MLRSRSRPTGRSSSSARSPTRASIRTSPNMTVETAVAIAGGFTPRAFKSEARGHPRDGRASPAASVPFAEHPVRPGDTINIARTLVLTFAAANADRVRVHRCHRSAFCMSCARPSAGCSGMSSILRADRPRAAIRSASWPTAAPAATRADAAFAALNPQLALGLTRVPDEPPSRPERLSRPVATSPHVRATSIAPTCCTATAPRAAPMRG